MNLGRLTKRLKKELAANPKQAAVLGIVCLVALWFWSPLLLKAVSAKKEAAAPTANGPAAVEAPAAATATQQPQFTWLEIHQWRKADPLTRSAPFTSEQRDPFASLQPEMVATDESATEEDTEQSTTSVTREIDPTKLGLVLESIAYGTSRRCAQINGQTFKEQDQVTLAAGETDSAGPSLVARVETIEPNAVTVNLQGRTLVLKLQSKSLGLGNVIRKLE